MTLEELKAADEKTKDEFGMKLYTKLVQLYMDQYGAEGETKVKTSAASK